MSNKTFQKPKKVEVYDKTGATLIATYGMDRLAASVDGGDCRPTLFRELFASGRPEVGSVTSGELDFTVKPGSNQIPRMAQVRLKSRSN